MWREVDPVMLGENKIAAVILGRNATPSGKNLCMTQVTDLKTLIALSHLTAILNYCLQGVNHELCTLFVFELTTIN